MCRCSAELTHEFCLTWKTMEVGLWGVGSGLPLVISVPESAACTYLRLVSAKFCRWS